MRIQNLILNGNNTGERVVTADTFYSKLVGLMGKTSINTGLLITRCDSIHTFFMKVPIDAVFIGNDNKILEIAFCLKPWKIVLPVKNADATLELASGLASKLNLKKGDIITYRGV